MSSSINMQSCIQLIQPFTKTLSTNASTNRSDSFGRDGTLRLNDDSGYFCHILPSKNGWFVTTVPAASAGVIDMTRPVAFSGLGYRNAPPRQLLDNQRQPRQTNVNRDRPTVTTGHAARCPASASVSKVGSAYKCNICNI